MGLYNTTVKQWLCAFENYQVLFVWCICYCFQRPISACSFRMRTPRRACGWRMAVPSNTTCWEMGLVYSKGPVMKRKPALPQKHLLHYQFKLSVCKFSCHSACANTAGRFKMKATFLHLPWQEQCCSCHGFPWVFFEVGGRIHTVFLRGKAS